MMDRRMNGGSLPGERLETAKRALALPEELDVLQHTIDRLEKTVAQLEGRLQPVSNPAPAPAPDMTGIRASSDRPLPAAIEALACKRRALQLLVVQLESLVERLEV